MKKLISVLLAASVFLSSIAFADELTISEENNIWSVNAVASKTVDIPTLRIYNADRTALYYIAEGTCSGLDEGGFSYVFDTFTFPQSVPSGSYLAVVGGNGTDELLLTFNYANPKDKADALTDVVNAVSKELTAIITADASVLGIDNTKYLKLPTTWKDYINDNLKKNDYSHDGTVAMVNKRSAEFTQDYNALLDTADVLGGSTSYDWGTVETALFTFSEALDTPIDFTTYNKLSSSSRASVIRSLKKTSISDYAKLEATFKKLVSDAKSGSSSSGGSSSGGGGGGGETQVSGTSGSSVYQTQATKTLSDELAKWLLEVYTISDKTQTIQRIKTFFNK